MSDPEAVSSSEASDDLSELLEETRILLPGSEVLVAFLISLPFTERFGMITNAQRLVFLATFFSALVALICFVTPAAYHRLASPIRKRGAFKVLANRLLVAGQVPLSCSLVLATYLVTSLASTHIVAMLVSATVLGLIGTLWWILPLLRAHDRCVDDAQPSSQRAERRLHSEAQGPTRGQCRRL